MKIAYILLILVVLFAIPTLYLNIKYRNPYKLIMIFGKKGAGKTTYLCKLAQKYLKKGWTVYSTVQIPGTYLIDGKDVGMLQFPRDSVILMDEVGMLYDNREFKNFKNSTRDYFKLQRHYGHLIFLFSQTWDIDLKLRNLTDEMYLLINFFGWLSVGKQIKRKIVVVKPTENTESRIADELVISPFILTPLGARVFTFIPHWAKYFNSFEAPELEHRELQFIEYPDGTPKRFIPKKFRKLQKKIIDDNVVVDTQGECLTDLETGPNGPMLTGPNGLESE